MRRVVLISGHYFESKRRAGFHWLAEAYWRAGWEVLFVTAPLSWLSHLGNDHRLGYPVMQERNRTKWVRERLGSYVWFTPWHPAHLRARFLNKLAHPFYRGYGRLPLGEAQSFVETADLFIFESTPGLFLFDQFKRLNPNARAVYRVSDDIRLQHYHPIVEEIEGQVAPRFDLISTPSEYIYRIFSGLPNAALHFHGLQVEEFEQAQSNPYKAKTTNVVFVGNSLFDMGFIRVASEAFPEWMFHIIGPISGLLERSNIIPYGELPFRETVPFIKFADIGLQNHPYRKGAESFTDSLKILQYSYCRLPIVSPEFIKTSRANVFNYEPDHAPSIISALRQASAFDRAGFSPDPPNSWAELSAQLAGLSRERLAEV